MSNPDPIFADARLAAIYDDVDGARDDLDHYVAIAAELGATRVLDVGCGTGSLACRLALEGTEVIGLDPAQASLDIARSKPGAEQVSWIHGDAMSLDHRPLEAHHGRVDLAVMTGNVAQVFTTDESWHDTLAFVGQMLRPGGHLVFETRDPAKRAWEAWDTAGVSTTVDTASGDVETWTSLLDVAAPLVSFRHHYRFAETGEVVTSDSTLLFRSLDEIDGSLHDAGFRIDEVRDAPDRPGLEFVVLASAT